ncbi:aldehyde dehydrogenase family protein [Sphingomonas immobilis]|uniref:Aldehyde dehydrogenase family protein n=1 Tax=Sphingomonas immobilis TaxID=3063997 RepID=A0ABT8ZTA4_9SPHN|nr:aldehyde dehydrogenase family protein [Sphingomonas sp. CA1-15]MDO7840791.1 aldehyde dehydrogenase family protein [Sphingomonas sp. CA1-15]
MSAAPSVDGLKASLASRTFELYIDGAWVTSDGNETITVDDPSTGEPLTTIAAASAADVDRAVAAARRAFRAGPWPAMPAARRAGLLHAFAAAIEAEIDTLALLESLDTGNTLASVRNGDIAMAQQFLRENAGWATKLEGGVPMTTSGTQGLGYWTREPVGVVGVITPWNAPFLMMVQKLSPALAAGCTVVVKPAELAPLTALRLGEIAKQVGFPDGVVNIVTGHGHIAGQALADHPDVNMISFTGSTAVGKAILQASGKTNLKRVILELGGKSPIVVFADADLDKAAASITREILFKSGQYCAAGTRLFVQASVFDPLLVRIRDLMDHARLGPGHDPATAMGPMISEKQRLRAESIVDDSVAQGARVIRGAARCQGKGFFYEPTLLADVSLDMRVMQEEVFAPVIAAQAFAEDIALDDLAALLNDTSYGLSSKIWSTDLGTVHRLSRKIEAGLVVVNGGGGEGPMPFGGYKQSGYGRENGRVGVEAFTEIKQIRMGF